MSAYSRWVRNISSPSERPGEAFNFIGGGVNNQVLGSCSAILGGSGNNDGGLPYVGIFGCNITGVTTCAFHANQFVAQNMYNATSAPPPLTGTGILYYCVTSPGQCTVYIA